ncbi:TonB-dependent receptor [Proteiniphilum sp. X52]|uniref:SusC/RagA family TonB-linked outer membrane protein n=1 Tax=Proteiniphilum sp. X52 TaxID=2382159 RepID=UPI000F09D66D|nr:TonB-dependent receptor [Proteiniphilum sp. X52]
MRSKNFYLKTRVQILSVLFCVIFSFIQTASVNARGNSMQQQVNRVTGKIVDEHGETIIGANIMTEDGKTGTVTDMDGNFTLNVPYGTKLLITYIGYESETIEAAPGNIRVVLRESSVMLEDVQIVAYGAQKKVTVTGAIAAVQGEELLRTPTSAVSNVLSGLVSGITSVQYSGEPGADAAEIFIRGKATWENARPLVQVDGVERSFNDIDPNEIESITVLKDASATAVFGVRGANGVLLITTKRGKAGKAKISFSTSASMATPTKMVELADAYQYATFHNQMRRNDGRDPQFSDAVLKKFQDGSDPIRFPNTNWLDYVMKDATLQTQHNVNISGGTESVRYFVSAGVHTQGGLFKQFDLPYDLSYQYDRYNYRSNLDIDVTETTTLSVNIGGNVDNAHRPFTGQGSSGMVRSIYWSTPFSSPGLVDGKLVRAATDYTDGVNLPFIGGNGMTDYYGKGFMATSRNVLNTDLMLNQQLDFIAKGLSFNIKGSYNSTFYANKEVSAAIATYTPVLQADGTMAYKKSGENAQPSYVERRGKARDWYMEAAFNYARSFNSHNISALALYNQSKSYYPSQFSDIPTGYVGLVGRVTYDWRNRYMAEFNMGYNGSENFAPERRFGFFPAGSVGWTTSEESFWENIKPVINYMKLRASWGLVGNDKVGGTRFMYTDDPYLIGLEALHNRSNQAPVNWGYYFGTNRNTLLGARESARNNPYVSWEKAFKQNYGIDISIINERLSGSFDYYTENRTDILLRDGTAPYIIGFSTPYANLGEVRSWGYEISLRWEDRIGSDFRYFARLNLSNNQNKIIERKETPQNHDWLYQKGHRIGANRLYEFWRFYDEQTPELYEKTFGTPFPDHGLVLQPGDAVFRDLNGDGKIDTEDQSYANGYTEDPEYLAGLILGFSWKNFSLSTQWTGAWKVSRVLSDVFAKPFTSNSSQSEGGLLAYHVHNTWTPENPSQDAKYPRATWDAATNNYRGSTLFEVNSSYLRLKSMEIAYNLKLPFMERINLNSCVVSLSGYNLLTFTDFIWGDPESRASNAPTYPLQKTYSMSLKLGF